MKDYVPINYPEDLDLEKLVKKAEAGCDLAAFGCAGGCLLTGLGDLTGTGYII